MGFISTSLSALLMVSVATALYTEAQCDAMDTSAACLPDVCSPLPPSSTPVNVFSKAAVVSQGTPCADIGRSMLVAGGNAVDAVIATLLCDGVCVMQSMGVGGGFIMTLYNKSEGKAYSLVARETAPAAATQDNVGNSNESMFGAKCTAVPGELKGYQEVHQRFGRLPWSDLFQPTIALCENGVPVNEPMARAFERRGYLLKNSSTFVNTVLSSTGGEIPKEGSTIKLPLLAKTLRVIANSSIKAEELYNGSLTKQFVADIQAGGGIITEQDMNDYRVRWEEPSKADIFKNYKVYSSPLPGSGILVTFILRALSGLLEYASSDIERSLIVLEVFKHAYGRQADLGDPHFVNASVLEEVITKLTDEEEISSVREKIKVGWTSEDVSFYGQHYTREDHGTDNIVVLDEEGNAVAVTSSVNLFFGTKFVSTSTGIILNNQLGDFSTLGQQNYYKLAPSTSNLVEPGKRPMSSMSPTIVLDGNGDVQLVLGAAGGPGIVTSVALVAIENLWYGKNIKEALDLPRYHHQLDPMTVSYEYGILEKMVSAWQKAGHNTSRLERLHHDYNGLVTPIARIGDKLMASFDKRKTGQAAGI